MDNKCAGRTNYCFTNWAKTYSCVPEYYFEPENEEEIKQILAEASRREKHVRVVGCGHSPSDIVCTNDYMISLKNFNRILAVNKEKRLVTVQAGKLLEELNEELPQYGLALPVQGAVSSVTIGGVVATGTHGSAMNFGVMGSLLTRATIMKASGEKLVCSPEENAQLFRAVACNLGALGVVLELTIQCIPVGNYEERRYDKPVEQVLDEIDSIFSDCDYGDCFIYPHTDKTHVIKIRQTNAAIQDESSWFWDKLIGFHILQFLLYISAFVPFLIPFINTAYERVISWRKSYRVNRLDKLLNFECLFSQYVEEWSVSKKEIKKVIMELIAWMNATGYKAHFPWELRFVKGDDILISPAHGEDRLYLNIICYRPYGKEVAHKEFFNVFEQVMCAHGGRPHWAKKFDAGKLLIRPHYPQWAEFERIREEMDPNRLFMNEYLNRFF